MVLVVNSQLVTVDPATVAVLLAAEIIVVTGVAVPVSTTVVKTVVVMSEVAMTELVTVLVIVVLTITATSRLLSRPRRATRVGTQVVTLTTLVLVSKVVLVIVEVEVIVSTGLVTVVWKPPIFCVVVWPGTSDVVVTV